MFVDAATRSATRSIGVIRGTSTRIPQPAEARLRRQVQLGDVAALVRRHATTSRSTPAAVRSRGCGRPRCPGSSTSATSRRPAQRADQPAEDGAQARGHASSGRSRSGPTRSSATARAPTSRPTPPAAALHFVEKALAEVRAGHTQDVGALQGARRGRSAAGSPRRCAACSRTTWSSATARSPTTTRTRRRRGTPARATPTARPVPYEDAVQNTPIFEENGPDNFKGIDIMRAVRSFDPCLPCGVHMYLGKGKVLKKRALADAQAPSRLRLDRDRARDRPTSASGAPDRPPSRGRPDRAAPRRARGSVADPRACDAAEELLAPGDELYGAGLARIVELVQVEAPRAARPRWSTTSCVGEPAVRARAAPGRRRRPGCAAALDSVRPVPRSGHGGDVELLELDEAHRRGRTSGCSAAATAARRRPSPCSTAVERAIVEAAPEIVTIDVEEPNAPDASAVTTAVELGRKPAVAVAMTPPAGSAEGPAADPLSVLARIRNTRPRERPRPGERCELCATPIPDDHEPRRRPRAAQPAVHLPRLLPALHARRRGRRPLPRGARPLRWRSPTSSSRRRSGTRCRSR